jgi:hypothetical protein
MKEFINKNEKFIKYNDKLREQLQVNNENLEYILDKTQSLDEINSGEQDLKTHWDGNDYEIYISFDQTHIFIETNANYEKKKYEFVFVDEDEEPNREEIQNQPVNLNHPFPSLKIHAPKTMNGEDQATEHDQVLKVSSHLQPHQTLYFNFKSAIVISCKIDASDYVSCESLKDCLIITKS